MTLPEGVSGFVIPKSSWGSLTAAKITVTSVPWAASMAALAAGVEMAAIRSTSSSTKPWQISASFASSPWASSQVISTLVSS